MKAKAEDETGIDEWKVWAAFLGLAMAWGTSFMFIKIAVQTVQPLTLVAIRLLIGWMGLMLIMRWRGGSLPRDGRIWGHLVVIGAVNVAAPFTLIVWAEAGAQGLDSSVASILNSLVPLFSIVIAGVIMHLEPVTWGRVLGLLTGFGGVVVLLGRGGDSGNRLLPVLAMVAAAFCYAVGSAYARRHLNGMRPVVLAAGQLLVADLLVLAAALLLEDVRGQQFPLATVGSLTWLGLVGSCLAYILYFTVLQAWGATRTTLVTYLLPAVGVTAGVAFLGETLDWRLLAGGALVLSGVAAVNLRRDALPGWLRLRRDVPSEVSR